MEAIEDENQGINSITLIQLSMIQILRKDNFHYFMYEYEFNGFRLAQTSDECDDANQRVFNRQSSTKSSIKSQGSSNNERKKQIKMDIMVIATNTLLQDLPFFCLRMVLIFR